MPDTVVCAVCGETNPADMEFCQNCQSRLQPLTGPLRGENVPIQPGDVPTKKVTSELEPVLPQWLREARQQARQAVEEDETRSDEDKPSQGPDLLAGLASQGREEEEETPDWVANITGAPAKQRKSEPEDMQVKWVELGHADEPAEALPAETTNPPPKTDSATHSSERDELAEWLKQASAPSPPAAAPVDRPSLDQPSQGLNDSHPAFDTGGLEWLKKMDADVPVSGQTPPGPAPAASNESLDWLQKLDSSKAPLSSTAAGVSAAGDEHAQLPLPSKEKDLSSPANLPAWLTSIGKEPTAASEPGSSTAEAALPDWLKPQATSMPPPASEPIQSPLENVAVPGELPDWIASLKPVEAQAGETAQPEDQAFKLAEPQRESASEEPSLPASAFTADSATGGDVDAIFASMKTPDWLADLGPSQSPAEGSEENRPPAAQAEESIAPAELPSWVQAMRPVESSMPSSPAGVVDTRLEEGGALAGLHGVLPVIPGAGTPSSKPKAHSIRLDVNEQQQAHAALLEKILTAETAPSPMRAGLALRSQRALRWAISGVLFVILGSTVFAGTRFFPLPSEVPNETVLAMRAVEAIPADAPVLVAFDYEPSTVGEMEATGASLMDHLLLLKHPHLALLSTSPTGAALAERFMSTTLAARAYQRGVQYVDLGYLPGGLAGVYDFAQNPTAVMPLGAGSESVWQSTALKGVAHLTDFAAVIVLTDNVDSGRLWIEQTASARGSVPMVMVSSAQAGPILLPYVESGQLSGLVSGLNGAAGAERANGGLPGYVRTYWDAYSIGLLLAAVAILIGGLWNIWLGRQDQRAQEAA